MKKLLPLKSPKRKSGNRQKDPMNFTSYDNESIWYTLWEAQSPKAVIEIFTGLAETADYYEEFAQEMAKSGFSVALFEFRKHGRTTASYGEGNLFRNFALDGAKLCEMIRSSHPGIPVILFAHSLGTTVSQMAVFEHMAQWDGVIYTGASHAVIDPSRKAELLEQAEYSILKYGEDAENPVIYPEIFGRLNAPFAEEHSVFSFITSDPERWKWIAGLPYTNPPYSNRFFRDFVILQADYAVNETLEKTVPPLTRTPILFLTGSRDVTACDGTYGDTQAGLLKDVGCVDVSSIVYPGFRHSILQEPGRMQVIRDVLDWLDHRYS